ncbi:PREDICTED: uncharacterized protein LOC108566776 isoform X2 [Nicrophorus vespilloides]|uniref:Uncharacterized protein LOC108566776 isoform X2 n=1 Tax=Nicrophorus vespilloides TaxID=110193 RepID=A0ABM1N650_NICVS|nr:PREDICTED: uncharacterized protein LOC108566776 isoform X2 [Nicrophorus vespilloides]
MKCVSALFFLLVICFSLGDELGFKESISNTEINRRRSSQGSKFVAQAALAQQANANSISVRSANIASQYDAKAAVPPFKPIPPAPEHPMVVKANATRYHKKPSNAIPQPAIVGMAIPEFNVMPVTKPPMIMKKSSIQNIGQNELALNTNSLQAILANANISESALESVLRQKVMAAATTTTTTTTQRPTKHSHTINIGKVMNAPREYYPVGYDKNFDDNFASRVELPETSFYCGDQKHFPGLYADEDLGCMVFHVCALTDDGLIMKSFLCPESTLFDQTILKCNWWFYVDCKNSKKLYDSNIPISKSYQLMKALTFFSTYKKDSAPSPKQTGKD